MTKGDYLLKNGPLTATYLPRIDATDFSWGGHYQERSKSISKYFKKEYQDRYEFRIIEGNLEVIQDCIAFTKKWDLEKTEREIAALEGIYHNAVHKRKLRILSKLKKLFEEI